MTVTIHPSPGQTLAELVHHLVRLADGNLDALRTGRGGVIVGDDLARTYLSVRPGPAPLIPVGPQMVPPALRAAIRGAERPLTARAPSTAGPPAST